MLNTGQSKSALCTTGRILAWGLLIALTCNLALFAQLHSSPHNVLLQATLPPSVTVALQFLPPEPPSPEENGLSDQRVHILLSWELRPEDSIQIQLARDSEWDTLATNAAKFLGLEELSVATMTLALLSPIEIQPTLLYPLPSLKSGANRHARLLVRFRRQPGPATKVFRICVAVF